MRGRAGTLLMRPAWGMAVMYGSLDNLQKEAHIMKSIRNLLRTTLFGILVVVGLSHSDPEAATLDASSHQKAPATTPWRGPPGVKIEPSRRMRAEGYEWDHEIQIALPASYAKTSNAYPVLWVTDGAYWFEPAVNIVDFTDAEHLPEMIVIAVGAPPEAANETHTRRNFDFSPKSIGWEFSGFGSEPARVDRKKIEDRFMVSGELPAAKYGGAPAFLKFLIETVRPALARDYRMADDNTLFGHSAGGTFCTYAFLARPDGFNKYVCGSPSLTWGDYELFRMEDTYARTHKDLAAKVFFGVGEAEILSGNSVGYPFVSSMTRMAEILKSRSYPSLQLHAEVFPGETHLPSAVITLRRGLRVLWEGDAGKAAR